MCESVRARVLCANFDLNVAYITLEVGKRDLLVALVRKRHALQVHTSLDFLWLVVQVFVHLEAGVGVAFREPGSRIEGRFGFGIGCVSPRLKVKGDTS